MAEQKAIELKGTEELINLLDQMKNDLKSKILQDSFRKSAAILLSQIEGN